VNVKSSVGGDGRVFEKGEEILVNQSTYGEGAGRISC